jgi:hypothetical protein
VESKYNVPTEPPDQLNPSPPPYQLATWTVLGLAVVLVLGLFSLRCELGPENARPYPSRTLPPEPLPVLLPPPPLSDDYFPCSDCHGDEPTNRTVRVLEDDHEDHVLKHGDNWCLHCHDAENRDMLHLADETLVPFNESWRLCVQCHAKKLADWRAGVHGKRTGHWWGPKEYRNCVECHNPHLPRFKEQEPKPAPKRPEQITLGNAAAASKEPSHEGF